MRGSRTLHLRFVLLAGLVATGLGPFRLAAYSFQTHEQIIDLSWGDTIKPFLHRRYPQASDAELERAHAYAEVILYREDFPPDADTKASQRFEDNLAQTDFKRRWEPYRKQPGIRTHLLAWVIFILPKVGPLSMLAIRGPQPDTHEKYIESVNAAVNDLRNLLVNWGTAPLPNRDLDTGDTVRPGSYRATDETYATLLERLTDAPSHAIPATLKENVLGYYADPNAPISTKTDPKKWARVQRNLTVLRDMSMKRSVADSSDTQ